MTATTAQTKQSPDQVLESLLSLMDRVETSYKQGITMIRAGDVNGFRKVQPDTIQLSRDYEIEVKAVSVRGATLKTADESLREKVLTRQEALAKTADEYQSLCLRMAESARRVQERLLNAARYALQAEQSAYAADGTLASAASGKPVATSINTSF
jgi:hypothetical protein